MFGVVMLVNDWPTRKLPPEVGKLNAISTTALKGQRGKGSEHQFKDCLDFVTEEQIDEMDDYTKLIFSKGFALCVDPAEIFLSVYSDHSSEVDPHNF